jgi:hypothetical protein
MIENGNAYGLLYIAIPVFAFAVVAVIQSTLVFLILREMLGLAERTMAKKEDDRHGK